MILMNTKLDNNILNYGDILLGEIDDIINKTDENISVSIYDINNESYIYKYNEKVQIISASLIKVPILFYVFHLIDERKIKLSLKIFVEEKDILEDTEVFENGEHYYCIEELLNWMIITSDNTATNVIIKYFGIENINKYITEKLNLKSTKLQRYMLDEEAQKKGLNNYTNQEDMLILFKKLLNNEILTPESCNKAIEILGNQRMQNQLLRYIYEPVYFFHKTGALDNLNHDCGIILINNKPYYIGVFIWNCIENHDKQTTGKIGKIMYNYLKQIEN